jgi:hypothetical protein
VTEPQELPSSITPQPAPPTPVIPTRTVTIPVPPPVLPPSLPEIHEESSSGNWWKGCLMVIGGLAICSLVCIAALVIASLAGIGGFQNVMVGSVRDLFGVIAPQPQARVIDSPTIVQRINQLGQLVSVSVQLAKADVGVSVYSGVAGACNHGANHVVQGAVEAGIDLTQISADSVTYDATSGTYTLTVPSPVITSCRIDQIRQYEQSSTLCNPDWDAIRMIANYTALQDFRNEAIGGGILERAQDEAQFVLVNFISALTGDTVIIRFEEAASTPDLLVNPALQSFPASCVPQTPAGWRLDPDNGSWVYGG